jgi:hypothetical protein
VRCGAQTPINPYVHEPVSKRIFILLGEGQAFFCLIYTNALRLEARGR